MVAFCILPHLTVWHTVLASSLTRTSPPRPPPPPPPQKKNKIWNLCLHSFNRELKIRVVVIVLKTFSTQFKLLIVSRALRCL